MVPLWDIPGVPHKGWRCIDVYDLREDGSTPEETSYATCEMCGNERIRYVHVLEHDDYHATIEVGCVCAEKLTDDYVSPRAREKRLKSKSARKAKWLQRRWRTSSKGNPYLSVEGHNLGVCPDRSKHSYWKYWVDGQFSRDSYPTIQQAKLELFEAFWERISDDG